ncbi:DUF1858 domain-containing protein [Enterococcus columbae]|uniref:DUF1858 domain-containing protein n=1 Tax=Enterococcus columbae DSM 7374 = ATCC 51263 TaxID=1121865 RepID=S0KG87_9ENTE|nr:DUF1858 domain-containing protein [Enterococcus columbae]EOT39950.1 hypothetical protein OMW_01739 [Enterococcus columbae DSM 7374 = ATCC 51263]EOW83935.1 hypothetical protein I568_01382 [Enterococcus columbae DSM 7374 = ATCC 51263]OJG25845.1 hypothetical protein RR47_GL001351 [Enterococcus columbae DSM 7374 = ATCC 51263]
MKELDLNLSLYDLVQSYPEILTIMFQLGFKEIKAPGMLQTAGRYMTIPKGARLKKIPLEEIIAAFEEAGFTVKGGNI